MNKRYGITKGEKDILARIDTLMKYRDTLSLGEAICICLAADIAEIKEKIKPE